MRKALKITALALTAIAVTGLGFLATQDTNAATDKPPEAPITQECVSMYAGAVLESTHYHQRNTRSVLLSYDAYVADLARAGLADIVSKCAEDSELDRQDANNASAPPYTVTSECMAMYATILGLHTNLKAGGNMKDIPLNYDIVLADSWHKHKLFAGYKCQPQLAQ